MTKSSDILVAPVMALRNMPPDDRPAVRRFLFEFIRGLNDQHDKRWRRMWSRMWKAEAGEVLHLLTLVDRSGPFHRFHMKFEQTLFDRQDRFPKITGLRNWLKTGAEWGEYTLVGERMKFVPRSTSYEQCSDDEMREVHEAMVEFLRTPRAGRRLWPHLSADMRAEMVESIVESRERQES